MKRMIFLVLMAAGLSSCFAPGLVTFNDDDFVEVYEIPGTKDELFLKANEWMVSIFNDAKSVIQHSDKEEGVIIGKYLMVSADENSGLYNKTVKADVFAVIDIRVREGRCRLAVQPLDYYYWEGFGISYSKERAADEIAMLTNSFREKLETKKIEF
jgi:hypothetical protein